MNYHTHSRPPEVIMRARGWPGVGGGIVASLLIRDSGSLTSLKGLGAATGASGAADTAGRGAAGAAMVYSWFAEKTLNSNWSSWDTLKNCLSAKNVVSISYWRSLHRCFLVLCSPLSRLTFTFPALNCFEAPFLSLIRLYKLLGCWWIESFASCYLDVRWGNKNQPRRNKRLSSVQFSTVSSSVSSLLHSLMPISKGMSCCHLSFRLLNQLDVCAPDACRCVLIAIEKRQKSSELRSLSGTRLYARAFLCSLWFRCSVCSIMANSKIACILLGCSFLLLSLCNRNIHHCCPVARERKTFPHSWGDCFTNLSINCSDLIDS